MGTIYNLAYDFSTQSGQSIVFSKKNGSKIIPADLNAVQLKMIQSNQIPHMLPLALENIDLTARLHYDINSKQKLITYFRDNNSTMSDYYQLFLSVINTLEEAGSYMLDQNKYILTMEFLYIGQHPGDVYLTYLPINDVEKQTSLTEDMKQLLTDVAGEVEGLQGNEFKSILNYIKNASFSITGLKKLLLELISLRSNVYQQQHAYQQSEQLNTAAVQLNNQKEEMQKTNMSEQQELVVAGSENPKQQKKKKKLPPLSSKEKTYSLLASALLIAFSWKLYDMYASDVMLIVAAGFSALVLAGLIIYWKFWRPGVEAIETDDKNVSFEEEELKNTVPQAAPTVKTRPSFATGRIRTGKSEQSAPAEEPLRPQLQPETQVQSQQQPQTQPVFATNSSSSALDTTLLNVDHDDTVLLEDENEAAAGIETVVQAEVKPILTRVSQDEEPIDITIETDNFLIGRNEESVNYVETALGVSRIHTEIIKIDKKSCGIKDLGSKNGSKLNGNPMVPYKLYALNENDAFEIGKAHYTFSWGMQNE